MRKARQRNIRKPLPIDEISHRVRPFLHLRPTLPHLNAHLVLTLVLPQLDPPPDTYHAVNLESKAILLHHWSTLAPVLACYQYRLSLTPHLFMGLNKFIAGRIY